MRILAVAAVAWCLLAAPASAQTAFMTSAYSYKTLAVALMGLMEKRGGGALVTLDFDNSSQAWPNTTNPKNSSVAKS